MIKLQKHNKHWKEGFFYEFEKHRDLFKKLTPLMEKKQIIAITGLRRTGKTVLLKQLINFLINNKVKRRNILYFPFDEEKPDIDKLIEEYAEITDIDLNKDKLYIFLDEIQKLENWQEQVKVYYDACPKAKIFISGSASLFIRKKATESLAGRIFLLELPILTFTEFLKFRNKENLLKHPKMFSNELKRELLIYFKRNFIEIINEDDETAKFYMESIINKIVYEDIPMLFPVENPDKLKAIVRAIYSNPGMIIKYENLARDLGLSSKTTEKYIFYLLQAKVIKKLYNFSRNFLTSEKKLKKFYVTAPCLCFLNDEFSIPKVAENIVAMDADFFWRDSFKNEVDCILKRDSKPLPVELKFRSKIRNDDNKGLIKFMDKFNVSSGIMITKDERAEKQIEKRTIKFIPLWKWLIDEKLHSSA